jgi:hypothetical protein
MENSDETDDLNIIRNKILEYLFDENNKKIKKWNKNKPVNIDNLWYFMLSYPYDFNKFKVNSIEVTKEEISNVIINLLVKNTDRIIHPGLIILCWDYLQDYLQFCYVYDNLGQVQYLTVSKGIKLNKLRYQIIVTFQIYINLLLDTKVNKFFDTYLSDDLLQEFKTKLFFNFQIETMIRMNQNIYESCNVRFNDICLDLTISDKIYYEHVNSELIKEKIIKNEQANLSELQVEYKNKVIVEINEGHHVPIIDNIRKLNIYKQTGRLSVDYPIAEMDFKTIYNKILKEVGKVLYKNYSHKHGIGFYLSCVDDFDIQLVPFFWEIYEKTVLNKTVGITVNEVLSMLKSLGLTKKLTQEKIMEELDESLSFIEFNNEKFSESKLSNVGVDQLILLPSKKDFFRKIQMVTQYTNFREKVFNSILEFFNNDEESVYIFKMINHINQMTEISENIIKPVIDVIYSRLSNNIIKKIEAKHNVKILKPLPFLVKTSNKCDSVDKKGLCNVVNKSIVKIIETKFEQGLTSIDSHKFLPANIINDLLTNQI